MKRMRLTIDILLSDNDAEELEQAVPVEPDVIDFLNYHQDEIRSIEVRSLVSRKEANK